MKRYFKLGFSSRPARETYRIDHTSHDGSGMCADDGNQRRELGRDRDDAGPVGNADIRSPSMRGSPVRGSSG